MEGLPEGPLIHEGPFVDHVRFSSPAGSADDVVTELQSILTDARGGHAPVLHDPGHGRNFYEKCRDFMACRNGDRLATVAFGGRNPGWCATIDGCGCRVLGEEGLLRVVEFGQRHGCRLRRLDLAVDVHDGGFGPDRAAWLYLKQPECYMAKRASRPPEARMAGPVDWLLKWKDMGAFQLGERQAGRTLYVGKRGSGKILRVYDKDLEQGLPFRGWSRLEVEFQASGDLKSLPWDWVLTERHAAYVGAYPVLQTLVGGNGTSACHAARIGYSTWGAAIARPLQGLLGSYGGFIRAFCALTGEQLPPTLRALTDGLVWKRGEGLRGTTPPTEPEIRGFLVELGLLKPGTAGCPERAL